MWEIRVAAKITAGAPDAPSAKPSTIRPPFRADIEGLRAVAILLVVAYHAGIPQLSGGFVGVDVFFVLSGYLISWLLIKEVERTGTISLPSFYGRRARRLLPGLAAVLLVTILAAVLVYAPYEQRFLANTAAATAGYFSNLYFAKAAIDYHGPAAGTNPFLHTWSLSVEEQFYLVWPLLVLVGIGAFGKRSTAQSRSRLLLWMLLAGAYSFALSLLLTKLRPTSAFFLSPARAWEFAVGATGILIPVNAVSEAFPERIRERYRKLVSFRIGLLGWLGLIGIILAGTLYDGATPFPGIAALLPTVSTVLVLRAPAGSSISRFLSIRPLTEIGRLSYSWYLWHWPVLLLIDALAGPLSLPVRIGLMLLSLCFAELSYRIVENPIHHNRKLALRPAYSLAMAAAITIWVITVALSWRHESIKWAITPQQASYSRLRLDLPVIYSMNCDQDYYSTELKQCLFGTPGARHTAVLLGDSHAAQWFPTVESTFVEKGWQLVVMTKSGCPIVDSPFFYPPIGRIYGECEVWRERAIERIGALKPDVVIIGSARYQFSNDQLKSGTSKVLVPLSMASKLVLLMRDTPKLGFDPTRCLARSSWRLAFLPGHDCRIAMSDEVDQVYAVLKGSAREFPNVSTIDMNPFICNQANCSAIKDGVFVFRDDNHLSNTFAQRLAGDFANQIESQSQILSSLEPVDSQAPK